MQTPEITFGAVVAGVAFAALSTFGAVASMRAIDQHLQINSCIAERQAAGWSTADCHERKATF